MKFFLLFFTGEFLIAWVFVAFVIILQYGFGHAPCELCTLQRMGWYVILLLSAVGLSLYRFFHYRWIIIVLGIGMILAFMWNILFSLLQLNLVYEFWSMGFSVCSVPTLVIGVGLQNFQNYVPCNLVLKIVGLYLPMWGILGNISIGIATIVGIVLLIKRGKYER